MPNIPPKNISDVDENIINIIDELRSENKDSKDLQKESVKTEQKSMDIQKESVKMDQKSMDIQKESSSSLQKISELTSKIIENNKSGDFDKSSSLIKEAAEIFKETSGAEQYLNFVEDLIKESADANKKFIEDNKKNIIDGNTNDEEIADRIEKSFKLADSLRNTYLKVWNADSVGHLKDIAGTVKGSVQSHLSEILGPVQELVDVSKQLIASTFKFVKSIGTDFLSLFGFGKDDEKETGSEKKRNNLLTKIKESMNSLSDSFKSMLGIEKARDKAKAREIDEKEPEGIWKLLLMAGALLAGMLFAYAKDLMRALKFILTPFKLLGKILKNSLKMFKEGGVFQSLGKRFKSIFGKDGKIANFFSSMWKGLKSSKVGKIFTVFIEKISGFFKSIFAPLKNFKGGPVMKILKKFFGKGMLIGRILLPFEMAYKAIKGFFSAEGIRDKILAASAGILDPILQIPEMIGNAGLWLIRKMFGKDTFKGLKFNFSTKKIIERVNQMTGWLETNVTNKIFDFFDKTLPDLWNGIMDWFGKMTDKIKFYSNPINWFKEYKEEEQGTRIDENTGALLRNTDEKDEDWTKRVREWRKTLPLQPDKNNINISEIEDKKVETAKNAYNIKQQQIEEQNKKSDQLLSSNKELSQQNQNTIQTIVTNNLINQGKSDPKEIPDSNENAILSLVSTGALM